ncbi:MAG: NAD-dependent epimerase/dehydratase family protein [Candidatus Omnitrophica bacterium]|nr:NAD-dependent epimerase/dehydratase family protein [Candidatus Omnitrophota bacterium]MDE2222940.1 NAD-dependent epimerase/dehydratase family protein [Candidatus Omnitrophota bacterium]
MNFLVTGGAGFIGSHIAQTLAGQGHFVRVLDNFSSGREENLEFAAGLGKDKFELLQGDIINAVDCDKACLGMDYVLHQAALRSVPKSMTDPLAYNKVNIDGIVHMLKAASRHKIKRFVFASSSSVYGDTALFPEKEEQPTRPISPYALSKLAGEHYCRIFSEFFGVETAALRYFNIFGPRQALDDDYAVVVPKFIHCIRTDAPPPIFGTGLQSRDFTYVDNVVSANILAATTPGIKHEVFNVACGQDRTVLELAQTLNRILGKNLQPQFLPVRAGDVFKTNADISKISHRTAYRPLVDFEEGLKRTVEYFKVKYK